MQSQMPVYADYLRNELVSAQTSDNYKERMYATAQAVSHGPEINYRDYHNIMSDTPKSRAVLWARGSVAHM